MQDCARPPCRFRGLVASAHAAPTLRACAPSTRCSSPSAQGLTLRNRVVSTSHEPAYAEDGMPKERYRLYHPRRPRRRRAHHDRRVGGGGTRQPAVVRQPAALQGRDRPVAARADRRRARGRCSGDVPGHPPRPAHQQLHRRLAAGGLRVAAARARAPQLPEGGRGLGPRPDRRRLRRGRRSAAWRPGSTASSCSPTATSSTGSSPPPPTVATTSSAATSTRRMAFPRRVVRAVRAAVGPDFVVGIRMSMDEDRADGLGRDEALAGAAPLRRGRRRLPQRHQGDDRERRDAGPGDPLDGDARRRRSSTSPARSSGPSGSR